MKSSKTVSALVLSAGFIFGWWLSSVLPIAYFVAALAVGSLAYWLRYEFRRAPEYYEPTGVDSIRDCAKGPDGTSDNGTKS